MQVGDRRVVAPDDVQRRVLGELRRAAGHGAVGPGPGLAAHAAAQRAAIHHGSRPACGRTATTCCRPTASRAARHSSAASPPAAPSGRSPRSSRAWISSSAASQEMRSNCPAPFGPMRRNGYSRRRGPCTKAAMSCATLLQITPSVNGIASEPRTFTMRSASTVTVRLQVSGQSKVQTLGRSSMSTCTLLMAGLVIVPVQKPAIHDCFARKLRRVVHGRLAPPQVGAKLALRRKAGLPKRDQTNFMPTPPFPGSHGLGGLNDSCCRRRRREPRRLRR